MKTLHRRGADALDRRCGSCQAPDPHADRHPGGGAVGCLPAGRRFTSTDDRGHRTEVGGGYRSVSRSSMGKQGIRLPGGPMLGCVTDRSARIWVRTPGPARVEVDGGGWTRRGTDLRHCAKNTAVAETSADRDYTALLDLGGLDPATDLHLRRAGRWSERTSRGRNQVFVRSPSPWHQNHSSPWASAVAPATTHPRSSCGTSSPPVSPTPSCFLATTSTTICPKDRTKQRVHYYRRQIRPEFKRLTAVDQHLRHLRRPRPGQKRRGRRPRSVFT